MFYCGIDIAKYKHEASVIDATGVALLDSIPLDFRLTSCESFYVTHIVMLVFVLLLTFYSWSFDRNGTPR